MIDATFRVAFADFDLDLSVSLPSRGVTVILGESGSGKTTLLRCIAGLQNTNSGYLNLNGEIWVDSQHALFHAAHQRSIGYVFQQANLFPHLTVADNIQFGRKRIKKALSEAKLQKLITILGIDGLMSRPASSLSGGEQQRVAIARALALEPAVLLMDEPLAALDWQRKQEILPYLQNLQQALEIPVIYVTHSLQEMAQLADYVVILQAGRVLAQGSLEVILQNANLAMNQQGDAFSVWPMRLLDHDPNFALSRASFAGGELFLPQLDFPVGQNFRLQIFARDVSITLEKATATSIVNILPARILNIQAISLGQCLVQLQTGDQTLMAHITRKSQEQLNLQAGMEVFAQIKGSSVVNQR